MPPAQGLRLEKTGRGRAVVVLAREGENLCWRWLVADNDGEGLKCVSGMDGCYQDENQG